MRYVGLVIDAWCWEDGNDDKGYLFCLLMDAKVKEDYYARRLSH